MRRVIYAWNYLEWGGSQIHFLALMKEARKHFEILVLLPEGSSPQFLSFLTDLGIEYRFFSPAAPASPATSVIQKVRLHLLKLKSELAMIRCIRDNTMPGSIVHVDMSPQQSLMALALLALSTPVYTTSHNRLPDVGPIRRLLWRSKFRTISLFKNFHVFCSNEDARAYFRQYYSDRVGDEIAVTYTSIDPEEINGVLAADIDRNGTLKRLGLPAAGPVVLAVGQFIDRKGRWVFLEAAGKLLDRTRATFVWVTPVAPGHDDRRRIDTYALSERFRIVMSEAVGKQRKEILSFFRVADVFVLPSFVEGLPIALLEAMALGVPSISTRVNGIPEAVKDNNTGLLVEPGDADGLADAIETLLNDPVLAKRIGEDGRKFVMENFDERVAARIVVSRYLKDGR